MLSLITGLGHLNYQEVKSLGLKVGSLLLLSWGLAFAAMLVMPLAYPALETASFFSTSLVKMPESVNFLELFIPANPFHALANNLVPAVVLFSVAVGVALIGLEPKDNLLDNLTTLNRAMARVTQFVSQLTPIGVFAIVASAAGTMSLEELGRLQVYLLTYVAMALVLGLWVLPALITSLTSLTYTQVIGTTRDVLITAFATGSALIVLPLLIERSKELLRQSQLSTPETEATVEVIVPAFTSFPKIGTLFPMSFVLFAGWFGGSAVSMTQYPTLITVGLPSFFGSVNTAIPFLLDLLRIPVDLFQLYLATTVVTQRFGVLLTTINNLVLTLLGACAVGGMLTMRWGRLLRNAVITVGIVVLTIGALRAFFTLALHNAYDKDQIIASLQLMRSAGEATVYTSAPPPLPPLEEQSRLERIQARKTIRVGYFRDGLPFSYINAAGDLVGFDIEMAHTLARDLNVALELVPIEPGKAVEQLNSGYCDIIMSGMAITPHRAQRIAFSQPIYDATVAFIVKDHRRDDFNSRNAVKSLKSLRIAIPNIPYYIAIVEQYLPQADVIPLQSIKAFFEQNSDTFDALVYSAEAGSAWTLLHPAYSVAIPQPDVLAAPIAYGMARGDEEMVDLINNWLLLKRKIQTVQSLYDYWVLGKNTVPETPRWSVIRNVLHWVE
ncbi:cation:dicarboxylate symporter family transporter [Candidatus Entotheonella palauensis]|nr:cation:dicarboxylase symporter family transporter [Candidatus Entotheonella palauensis]